MIPYLNEVFLFLMGLCIGSFLNVCIYRLPASQSIVHPRSTCPNCDTLIAFYDNIPVISYLWLKGQCRHCKVKISLRYPTVELLGGLFALATYLKFGLGIETLIYYLFIAALLAVTFIDIDHRIIPDVITLPGIPIGFAASFVLPAITYKDALLGILIGGGSLLGHTSRLATNQTTPSTFHPCAKLRGQLMAIGTKVHGTLTIVVVTPCSTQNRDFVTGTLQIVVKTETL